MTTFNPTKKLKFIKRLISGFIGFAFLTTTICPGQVVAQSVFNLPAPGAVVTFSQPFTPPLVRGITLYPDNPLKFDFIVDVGDDHLQGDAFQKESMKLIKYFLVSLTVPENDMWVNLSPYEKDRIVPEHFGKTEMGKDLLLQDYMLKQLTASLMNPEQKLGQEFWQRVRQKAKEKFGADDVPTDTFNPPASAGEASPNLENWAGKVWIVPDRAQVYVKGQSVYVVDSHLKVMLEEDYLAAVSDKRLANREEKSLTANRYPLYVQLIKEIILPEIEREVNEGKNFALLRQIQNSAILAAWYKKNLKQTLLGKVYVDQKKTDGINSDDKEAAQKIYGQYLEAFKKGVYDFIKEDYDPTEQQVIPRKYFSGGIVPKEPITTIDSAALAESQFAHRMAVTETVSLESSNDSFLSVSESSSDAAMMSGNGIKDVIWFEGLDRLIFADVRKKIFGENVESWLNLHNRNGDTGARIEAARQLLRDDEFIDRIKNIAKDDVALEIIFFAIKKNIYLGTKSFKLFLDALKQQANKDVKKYIPTFSMPISSFVQLISNIGMIQESLDRELLEKPANERLVGLVEKIRELGLKLDSDNLGHIYSALPNRLSAKVKKDDIQLVQLPKAVYDQLQAALSDERVQGYLDRELLEKPANERLVGLVEKIRELGLKLDSDNLGQIYSALPNRLSAKVKKDDIQKVELPKAVYDQLQAALSDERVQRYLKDYERKVPRRRLWAGDLLETLKGFGFRLSTNPISFHGALPSYLKKFVVSIKRNYHTDSDGKLVVKIYRSYYLIYNFSRLPSRNGFWANRNVFPLWNNAGEIVAFEIENGNQSTMTINASEVIEQGIPIAQAVTQYRGQEIWQEVVSHDRKIEDTIQFEDWSRKLEEVIRSYNGTEIPVAEYLDFLVSLFALKQIQGISANEMLETAASETAIDPTKARDFLQFMVSPGVRAKGLDVEAILSPEMITDLQKDKAMLNQAPGGIDLNSNEKTLEETGEKIKLPILVNPTEWQNFQTNGFIPVIINIAPPVPLTSILLKRGIKTGEARPTSRVHGGLPTSLPAILGLSQRTEQLSHL